MQPLAFWLIKPYFLLFTVTGYAGEKDLVSLGGICNALSIVLVGTIIYVLIRLAVKMKNKHSLSYYALALVVGGALGNFYDRLSKGTVTDMFDFRIWPVFNVADMALVIGLLYIAYRLIFHGEDF